jgi:RNA polymerase sigma-70 factor (ECF subfamily)
MDDTDKKDWRLFRRGEKRAFDRIYVRHKDRMYSYCLYTSGDPEMSSDVVQESFMKLLQKRDRHDFESGLDNWLFVCVRNCLFNHLKRRRVRQSHEYGQIFAGGVTNNPGEARVMLQQVLAHLAASERDIILMREFLGLTIPEISNAVGASEGAVRVRLHRIRKRLTEVYREDQ